MAQQPMSDIEEDIDRLVRAIHAVFLEEPAPTAQELIAHKCEECQALQEALAGLRWREIPRAILEKHYDQLPLLSPKAFHYYIPAYLAYSLRRVPPTDEPWANDIPASLSVSDHQPIVDFTIYSLAPGSEERLDAYRLFFTKPQARFVRDWLSFIKIHGKHFDADLQAVERALSIWNELAGKP